MTEKVKETESWFSSNPEAETAEYEAKQKELESAFNPIMQKIYAQGGAPEGGAPGAGGFPGGAGGFPGGFPGGGFPPGAGGPPPNAGSSGPSVDEVD